MTFHDRKTGMDEAGCGEIVVADVGIPADAERFVGPGDLVHYPVPSLDAHKGQNGRLLVIGGGPYTGAPALAAMAAYRVAPTWYSPPARRTSAASWPPSPRI